MTGSEIREQFTRDICHALNAGANTQQQTALAVMGCSRALVEVAAQLAEQNELAQESLRDQFAMAAMQADTLASAVIAASYIGQGKSLGITYLTPLENE